MWDKTTCKAKCLGSPSNLNPAPLGMPGPGPEVGLSAASRKLLQGMFCSSATGAQWLKVSTSYMSWYSGGVYLGWFANCSNLEVVISRSFPWNPNFLPLLFSAIKTFIANLRHELFLSDLKQAWKFPIFLGRIRSLIQIMNIPGL